MPEFSLPVLGFSDWSPNPSCVQWKNGTVICRGILGAFDPETLAAERAEQERKEELRSHDNIVLLEDYR
jgi:hypothetical protein